jgi:hypothetical protein
MTKQIPDMVVYKGQEFILAGRKGSGLFTPKDFGISSDMMGVTTACYRRYFSEYLCLDDELSLVKFSIIQAEGVEAPLLEGSAPKSDGIGFAHSYEDLRIHCLFSGGLILVRNPVGLVGHFPSPIEFDEVLEVLFKKGKVQRETDHSATVASLRKQVDNLNETLKSNSELSEVLRKWDSPEERVSESETELFDAYINEIVNKTTEVEWSFVSEYVQQPPTF